MRYICVTVRYIDGSLFRNASSVCPYPIPGIVLSHGLPSFPCTQPAAVNHALRSHGCDDGLDLDQFNAGPDCVRLSVEAVHAAAILVLAGVIE